MIQKSESEVLKEIRSGKYRHCYLMYNRKSTDEPNNQRNSIKYQEKENGRYSLQEKLPIADVTLKNFCRSGMISERHSGYLQEGDIVITEDGKVQYSIKRPKFQRLAYFLSKGYFKGVISLCWDRASRNRGDDTVIAKLEAIGINIRFAFARYDNTASGMFHRNIDGIAAEHRSRETSEKVRTAVRNLRERGIYTSYAPIGYLNIGKSEHKPFDKERVKTIKRLFELCDEGTWSISDLAVWANDDGLTTVPRRRPRTKDELLADDEVTLKKVSRPITRTHVHNILTNRFYTGKIRNSDGIWVKSVSHKALVSNKLFNRVQDVLASKNISKRYTNKLDLPYRGKIRCGECLRAYCPYTRKGIQYFGVRCASADCPNQRKNINLAYLDAEVAKLIGNLYLTERDLHEINARANRNIARMKKNREKERVHNERRKKKLREELKYLDDNRLTLLKAGVFDPEKYVAEETRLKSELAQMQEEEQVSEDDEREIKDSIATLSELLENAVVCHELAKPSQKEEITDLVFSELFLSGNTLNYKCQIGFQFFESRFVSNGARYKWLSELGGLDEMRKSIVELKKLLGKK